jgi:hypothetical protein
MWMGLRRTGSLAVLAIAALCAACDSQTPSAGHTATSPTPAAAAPAPTEAAPAEAAPLVPLPDAGSDAGASLLHDSGSLETIAERLARERYQQNLDIDHLLSRGEVREVTGYTGTLSHTELEGQEPSQTYNAFRLAGDQTYGFGLQVWKLRDGAQATSFFNRMHETYVVTANDNLGDTPAFEAELGGIRQLVFVAAQTGNVVALSCDETVCPDDETLAHLAERVLSRL